MGRCSIDGGPSQISALIVLFDLVLVFQGHADNPKQLSLENALLNMNIFRQKCKRYWRLKQNTCCYIYLTLTHMS